MKKTFAILLLGIHFFNICGYQLFFSFAENIADKRMVASLDANRFNENDLVQIKLPLNIPYTTDWKDYERCDGEVQLNGIHYNYVKRIVYHDTMYLYCIPNEQKTELSNSKNEYAKLATDVPFGKKTDQANSKRNEPSGEYNVSILHYDFLAFLNCSNTLFSTANKNPKIGFRDVPAQPPDITA